MSKIESLLNRYSNNGQSTVYTYSVYDNKYLLYKKGQLVWSRSVSEADQLGLAKCALEILRACNALLKK